MKLSFPAVKTKKLIGKLNKMYKDQKFPFKNGTGWFYYKKWNLLSIFVFSQIILE